jgi:hypothetical protein
MDHLPTKQNFIMFISLVVIGVATGLALFTGHFLPAVLTLLVIATAVIFAGFRPLRHDLSIILLMLFTFLVDSPWGRAFYDWDTFTKPPGHFLLSSMHKSLGISGLSVSIFEALSLCLALGYWFKGYWRENSQDQRFKLMALSGMLLPLAAAFGVTQGLLRGNDLGSALTQTRALVTLPVWMFLGWCLGQRSQQGMTVITVMTVLVWDMVIKSLQGLYLYFVVWGGQMTNHEYIIEHLTSDYLLSAALFLLALLLCKPRGSVPRTLLILPLPVVMTAYLLNHRRSSMVGLVFSLVLILLAMPKGWLRFYSRRLIAAATLAGGFILITWTMDGPLGFLAHTVRSIIIAKSESSRDYRIAENLNLYAGLSQNILLGLGLGRRFDITHKMDDISVYYADFNLVPHNTLLFLWAFIGPVGIAAFATFMVTNMSVIVRLTRQQPFDARWIVAALAFTMLIRWSVYVYSDLGLTEVRSLALLGLVLGSVWRMTPTSLVYGGDL